jgi:uncharacterized protein YyaL (SSP411 family)
MKFIRIFYQINTAKLHLLNFFYRIFAHVFKKRRILDGEKLEICNLLIIVVLSSVMSIAQSQEEITLNTDYSEELQKKIQDALEHKGKNYHPKTIHLLPDGQPKFTNRLILEDSPYLLQHAHNPVNWFAWSDEAFARAKEEKKPIFLSVGYSTCHWCHVMERESFSNLQVARLLNEKFVCIKVDREQRPDIDAIYMISVMMIGGHGGWPMSAFLTPEGKPFYGGTYFKPDVFLNLLKQINALWDNESARLVAQAETITESVNKITSASGEVREVGKQAIQSAVDNILSQYDDFSGGFGDAPKFPQESWLLFLLQMLQRMEIENPQILSAIEKTLNKMAQGGIYDQVAGGFHRYSTDAHWLVPHFEKMLYNQAHLARVYLIAYQLTGKKFYAAVARQILDYVLREITSKEGGFYSATDADSEGEEGKFFVWTYKQLQDILNKKEFKLVKDIYGVTKTGNFDGSNILYLPLSLSEYAEKNAIPLKELVEKLMVIRIKLRTVREKRESPLKDDKILMGWNGMMITTLALAFDILGDSRYLESAKQAAEFIWTKQQAKSGEFWRVYHNDNASIPANQEDYAYFAESLVTLYDVDNKSIWLERAESVVQRMLEHFWDEKQGGFFMSTENDNLLIARPKNPSDDAIPSGNAVAVRVLSLLAHRMDNPLYQEKANATIRVFSAAIAQQPVNFAYMLMAVDTLLHGEMGSRLFAAQGAVRATTSLTHNDEDIWLNVELQIKKGWHINAHKPLQDALIPTELTIEKDDDWALVDVEYPAPKKQRLDFQQAELALYDGTIKLRARLAYKNFPPEKNVVIAQLKLQACNNSICLAPETLAFQIVIGKMGY